MTFKVIRHEEEDGGASTQVTVTWTIQKFRNVYAKARCKQRLKSPAFHVPNVAAFDLDGGVVLFPKGLGREGDPTNEPLLAVELRHAPRDPDPEAPAHAHKIAKKRIATPIGLEVEAFTDATTDDVPDPLGLALGTAVSIEITKRTALAQWQQLNGAGDAASPQQEPSGSGSTDTVEIPYALSAETMDKVNTSLTLVVKITMLSHADDVSDVSDDFGLRPDPTATDTASAVEEETLFSNVLTRGQGMWQQMLSEVATAASTAPTQQDGVLAPAAGVSGDAATTMSSAAAAASAMVAGATAELFQRHPTDAEYSAEWMPLVELYCSGDMAPMAWQRLPPGCWNVLVHCLVDMDHLLLRPSPAWVEATAGWSRPAPSAVTSITEWCPPLRLKLVELIPHQTTFKEFWVGFFCALDACARIDPLRETRELEEALLGGVAAKATSSASVHKIVQQATQLVSFVLLSHAPDVVQISALPRTEVEAQLEAVREACQILGRRFHGGLSDNHIGEKTQAQLELMVAAWRREESTTLKEHATMVERARSICEHGSWSLAARRTLAAAGDRSAHSVSEVADTLAMALEAAVALSKAPMVI